MPKTPTPLALQKWHAAIENGGRAKVKARSLLAQFGYSRRGSMATQRIEAWLREQGIYVQDLPIVGIDEAVTLTHEKIERIGELEEKEKHLEARFVAEIMPRLGLTAPKGEYSPKGTRDRLDFLCRDKEGRSVVVELKVGSGDKRAVEQVMRYIGQLKREGTHESPRGILITGYADAETRRALEGREKDAHIEWYIYGVVDGRVKISRVKV